MLWLCLIPVVLYAGFSAWLSFRKEFAEKWWLPWAFAGLSVLHGLWWAAAIRWAGDEKRVYLLSLGWDVALVATWVIYPVLAGYVKPTPGVWAGVALMLVGLGVCKASS